MSEDPELARAVKALALEEGFARAGVASAGPVPGCERLETFLAEGYYGQMAYLTRNVAKRRAPNRLVPGARSVLCLAVGCAPARDEPSDGPFVARHARGRDYHKVLKKRCRRLMDRIRGIVPGFDGRAFVDSAPVMERTLAHLAGLGWIGRNGCLVVPGLGSHVLLCEIVSNLPLPPDASAAGGCGSCDACVKACPTGAIVAPALIDARKCVSYLTIEHDGVVPEALRAGVGGRVFGCDACQEACPHNRDLPAGDAELLGAGPPLGGASIADLLAWDREQWDAATRGRATRRASLERMLRNAVLVAGNAPEAAHRPLLEALSRRDPELRELARWALARARAASEG